MMPSSMYMFLARHASVLLLAGVMTRDVAVCRGR